MKSTAPPWVQKLFQCAVVAWMPERFRGFADKRVFVFGVALVLVMVFRPQGLIPRKIRKERWLANWKPPQSGEAEVGRG